MFEKVSPMHPDKQSDRIGGAIVDLGYKKQENPKIAGEILLGHGNCHIILETSVEYQQKEIQDIIDRITQENIKLDLQVVPQDNYLAANQSEELRCGDNGIFKGSPITKEMRTLTEVAKAIYKEFPFDGKYVYDEEFEKIIVCQSHAKNEDLKRIAQMTYPYARELVINPLGEWTGGSSVDTGAVNRKLGSDMGNSVTGGGVHAKDLSKADVSVNIVCHNLAQLTQREVYASCAIGDTQVMFKDSENNHWTESFEQIVKEAKQYIDKVGGFEKFAEWGLVR